MASARIRDLTAGLPYSLREAVEGYVDAVSNALPEIQRDARVQIEGDREIEFLFVVAIRRMWSTVNTQYWIMNDCIQIAAAASERIDISAESAVRGFRIGRDEISANSQPFLESRQLRGDLDQLIKNLEISQYVQDATSLSDLAQRMFADAP
jgi:hypothetical protein